MPEPGGLLILSVALCVAGALVACLVRHRLVLIGFVAAQALAALGAAGAILASGTPVEIALWRLSSLGRLILVLDPIAALFVMVAAIVFLVGVMFAAREAAGQPGVRLASFAALYQLLFGASVLVLVAGDVLSFIIGWELMSLLLFALVTFDVEQGSAGRAGYVMLALSEAGTIAGLLGLLLLAVAANATEFASLRQLVGLEEGLRWTVFLLTFFGFGVKAGVLPVNQWLPDAYTASPRGFTPVLAGATTNLGIYALLRVNADLLPPISVGPGLVALVVGSLTALVGILYATVEPDLRRALAHSSIENMGIIIAALGAALVFTASGHSATAAIALIAGLYHLVNHSFYKALLFTGAAVIDARVGTTDMDRLGGLIRRMPWTAALFLVGVLAIAALPPFNGFVSEWLTLQTMLRAAMLSSTVVKIVFALSGAVLALTAGLALTCFAKVFAMSFLGLARSAEAAAVGEGPSGGRVPMAALGLLCLLLGVLPTYVVPVIDRTVTPIVHASASEALVPPFFRPELAGREGVAPEFMGEFHDLGAQTGGDLLPGRGLVVLHRGGAANPVVFAMSTSYAVLVLMTLLALAFVLFRLAAHGRAVLRGAVWDGGLRRLRPSMTYTATGFSNPVRVVFDAVLRPATIEDSTDAVAEHFRTAIRRQYGEAHLLDRLILAPAVDGLQRLAGLLRRMHIGQVNAYAAYVLLALLLALVVGASAL